MAGYHDSWAREIPHWATTYGILHSNCRVFGHEHQQEITTLGYHTVYADSHSSSLNMRFPVGNGNYHVPCNIISATVPQLKIFRVSRQRAHARAQRRAAAAAALQLVG